MSNRTPRELETRQETQRRWRPPSLLPDPVKEDGYSYRWVRIRFKDENDDRNITSKRSEGWEPVRLEDHPEITIYGKSSGNVEIGGLMLCKTPTEFVHQRNDHYRQLTKAQADGVDHSLMSQNDPRMPVFSERKSTTSRGKRD
jgi:hypothetical protein